MQKQIFVLADLHVGSASGLLPPDFMDTEGNVHSQNLGQQYLWDRFIDTLNRIQSRPISIIVLNGDLLDGSQKKADKQPLTLHRLQDQREAAVKVLEEVRSRFPKVEWKFVSGTPYHELAEEMSQVSYYLLGAKQDVQRTQHLRVGEAILTFHHELTFSSALLKGNTLERAIVDNLLASTEQGWPQADALIRSHCHYFRYLGRKNKLALVTPCWQLQTDYVTKRSPDANIPDLGAVVLTVDDSLKQDGICPVGFTEYLHKHPAPIVKDMTSAGGENDAVIQSAGLATV